MTKINFRHVWIHHTYGAASFAIHFHIHNDKVIRLKRLLHIYAQFSMLSCMRTTIEISDELCRQLKRKAADEGVTIRQVVESALRVYLGKQTRR